MNALMEALDALVDRPLGTVVHVHPVNPELVQRYAALGARRVVLVSGDPDALPGLRRLLPGRPWLELVEAVVAPHAGDAHWLRYNVPSFNGLLGAAGLHDFYPRLRLHERLPVQTRNLQAVLDGVRLECDDGANVLVLESPGLEDAIVRSLDATMLQRFEWMLLRGARLGLLSDGAEPHAVTHWLQTQAWREVLDNSATQPLWPVTVLQFDATAAERLALMRRVEEGEAKLRTLMEAKAAGEAAADKLVRDREAQIETLSQAKSELEMRAAEQARQVAQVQTECTAMSQRAAQREVELRTLIEAKAAAEQEATQRAAQIQALNQAKAALEKSLAEQAGRLQQAHAERDGAKAALDKATADRTQQVEQVVKARDEYAKHANERQKRIVQLDAELAELTARHALLQEELIKCEAHVELIADLLLRESLR